VTTTLAVPAFQVASPESAVPATSDKHHNMRINIRLIGQSVILGHAPLSNRKALLQFGIPRVQQGKGLVVNGFQRNVALLHFENKNGGIATREHERTQKYGNGREPAAPEAAEKSQKKGRALASGHSKLRRPKKALER
jgi:hypothetical protein